MKLKMKLVAALCVMLIACACVLPACAFARTAVKADRDSTLWVDISKMTLSICEKKDVRLTWKSTTGTLHYSWDNASVIEFKKSGIWEGNTTTLTIKGIGVGRATITISNSENADTASIEVTVVDETEQNDVSAILGLSVKGANARLSDKLKAVSGGYSNGYFRVALNSFKRIREITLTAFGRSYTLFAVYPGMKFSDAAAKLKKAGWKQVKKMGTSVYYLNDEYLCRAICLEKSGDKVAVARYYVP